MKKISYVRQIAERDCGISCLSSIIKYYGGYVKREYLREITNTTREGVSLYSLKEGCTKLGIEAKAIQSDIKPLGKEVPFIAHILKDNLGHFVVISKITNKYITIMDPSCGIKKIDILKWNEITTNIYLLLKPVNKILKQENDKKITNILFPLLKQYKVIIIFLLLLSLIYTLSNILISYQFQFFLELLNIKNLEAIKLIFIFLISIICLKEIANLFRSNFLNYFNHLIDKTLLRDAYTHIIKLPYLYFKNHTKGDLITRIQDIFQIREVISKLLIACIMDFILIIFIYLVLLKISLKLSLIVFITTLLYLVIIYFYNKVIIKKLKNLKEEEIKVNNHLIETITSYDTIKSMQIEDNLLNKLLVKYSFFQDNSFNLYKSLNKETFFKNLIYGLGLLIIIYLGIKEVYYNNLSLNNLLVFNSLLIYFFDPLQDISSLQITLQEARLSFLRIQELFNVKEETLDTTNSINTYFKGNIKINNLIYSYNNIDNTLKCDKLEILAGEKVLLYGPTGSGKSTLMKLLVRYFSGYQGLIEIDDRNIQLLNLLDIRRKITYVSQDEILYTDTIYNNIVLDNKISYSEYLDILKITGVDLIINRSLLKNDMLIENNGSNLSGGEKQRILLARALVKKSDIYIFDESLSAIDIKNERLILKNIFKRLKNKTIIVISHRFNNKDLYQRYVLINKGVVYDC
ncbi:MAG: cysteine peptidase family C39 domain-containing protein [Erysipelotrichaceae bacterium]|nr:cysteine peptidase family C39 domain-containing protein [Erysipelotrichaceae bacterium]